MLFPSPALLLPRRVVRGKQQRRQLAFARVELPDPFQRLTGAFVAGLGAIGYATRRDLSSWWRVLFWALLALIVFGIVAIFVSIPHANVIYCVLGLVIFGGFTIFDFNRLRRAGIGASVPIAASIFLDIFNVFLFMLRLFGGNGRS